MITELNEITNSEWQIMRVIWTLKKCTSRQVIRVMSHKQGWKASTVKTLITRLKKKGFIKSQRVKNKYLYSPKINEQKAANLATMNVFRNICPMHAGNAINHLVQNVSISKSDVKKLIKTLKGVEKTAPNKVKCNCLDPDAEKEVDRHENES
ncbi:MAG: CopY/TcrY family copper transport repressor [Acetilactobacillus jinshanensis]